jgi:hypothetical protein
MGTEAGAPPGCGYEYFDVIDVVGRDLERIGGAPAPVPTGTNISCLLCCGFQHGHRGRCPSNNVAGNFGGLAPAPVPVGTNVSYWAGYFPT